MDQKNSPKREILKAIAFFVLAVGGEIALCGAIVIFALPLNVVRLVVFILWLIMVCAAWTRFKRRVKPASEVAAPSHLESVTYMILATCYAGVGFLILHFGFQAFRLPSGSMEPTILIGDQLVVKKFHIQTQRGDIITFELPPAGIINPDKQGAHQIFLKRVVGMPGDEILIRDKQLIVNGRPLSEPYVIHLDTITYPARVPITIRDYQSLWESGRFANLRRWDVGDNFGPVHVPSNAYFVLGDNRDASFDSRFWGPLLEDLVTGKAIRIYSPPAHAKGL